MQLANRFGCILSNRIASLVSLSRYEAAASQLEDGGPGFYPRLLDEDGDVDEKLEEEGGEDAEDGHFHEDQLPEQFRVEGRLGAVAVEEERGPLCVEHQILRHIQEHQKCRHRRAAPVQRPYETLLFEVSAQTALMKVLQPVNR